MMVSYRCPRVPGSETDGLMKRPCALRRTDRPFGKRRFLGKSDPIHGTTLRICRIQVSETRETWKT